MTLPIFNVIDQLNAGLATHQTLILQAPPGSGKTTQVPLALLNDENVSGQKILLLEPRRLAATNSARYMAHLLGEPVGQTVGYSIRYQKQVSTQTRIEVVTEGILTRRLQNDPELHGIGLIIFDEFHERNLNSDLALALCHDVQQGLRDDLKILIMSATLDSQPLAELLNAAIITCEGRSYPVAVDYIPHKGRSLVDQTVAAVHRALQRTGGDILTFLPGSGEIERCHAALADLKEVDVHPLYGSLPFAKQEAAIRSGPRRKVVLATNIAETSLTIEGIETVIDSGYARQPRFDPNSGLTGLKMTRISAASAEQRAGRAGRLSPGHCYRLWTKAEHGSLLPFTPPEMRNADLAPLALDLAGWGITDPSSLCWLDPPPPSAFDAARKLLQLLGAMTPALTLTSLGQCIAKFPAHPRLGRLLITAQDAHCLPLGCDLVALLSEVETRPSHRGDLQEQLEQLRHARTTDHSRKQNPIERAARYWHQYFSLKTHVRLTDKEKSMMGALLASAYPDRIGRRRKSEKHRFLFTSGKGGFVAEHSPLTACDFLVATSSTVRSGADAHIRQAMPLRREDLIKLYPDLPSQKLTFWDEEKDRVISRQVTMLGSIPLSETPAKNCEEDNIKVILERLRTKGLTLLNWSQQTESFRNRITLLRATFATDTWPDFSDQALQQSLEDWLAPFLTDCSSAEQLKRFNLLPALTALLDWTQQQQLDHLAPERIRVASGSQIRLQYQPAGPPVLAVKLQEMFGTLGTPRICDSRIAVQLHLLSPAGRPLQVTQDLPHFWTEIYPEVKKEMKGRYPKHPWPDNPLTAQPTRHTRNHQRRTQ